MDFRPTTCFRKREARYRALLRWWGRWWRMQDASERYLADAADHADLERRMRAVERSNRGPALITFNH